MSVMDEFLPCGKTQEVFRLCNGKARHADEWACWRICHLCAHLETSGWDGCDLVVNKSRETSKVP